MSETGTVNQRDVMALQPTKVTLEQNAQSWRIQAQGHTLTGWAPSLGGEAGSGFRAADLLLAALGLCLTDMTMAYCKAKAFPLRGISVELEDHSALEPLRIDAIRVIMHLEGDLTDQQIARIYSVAAKHCKIKNTLAMNPKVDLVIQNRRVQDADSKEIMPSGIKCAC